jgi:AraC-like DNA-binding protein
MTSLEENVIQEGHIMESRVKLPLHIALPGIDVMLIDKFFGSIVDQPPMVHSHPCFELICVQECTNSRFVVVPPHILHLAETFHPQTLSIDSILFSFLPESDGNTGDICGVLRQLQDVTELPDTFSGAACIEALKAALTDTRPGLEELMQAQLRLLLVQIARQLCKTEIPSEINRTLDNERLGLLEEYFNLNFTDPQCSKQQLAQRIGVSERQLSRILMETYHAGFSAILLRLRMSMATALMRSGVTSAAVIAEATGYISPEAFKRAYKAWAGHRFGQNDKEGHTEQ